VHPLVCNKLQAYKMHGATIKIDIDIFVTAIGSSPGGISTVHI